MDKKLLFCSVLLAVAAAAQASTADSALVERLSVWSAVGEEAWLNPALHGKAYQNAMSELYMKIDWRRQSRPFVPEKGDGYWLPDAFVDTYLRLSPGTTVWGKASYVNGRNRNIRWNSTSDYDLLQPYIIGDTIGGDTHTECYAFSGGYATQKGRLHMGAELLFHAEQEYRDTDPRMRGIVNDLTLRAGTAWEQWHYRWGLALEGNVYKQTNDVDFYREAGVIPEYQMLGLGAVYTRFSGSTRDLYYHGAGIRVCTDVQPVDGQGAYGSISLLKNHYRRVASEFNSLPLTTLYRDGISATAGWKRSSAHDVAVYGQLSFVSRSGDEHVAGTSSSSYYPVIARLTMYKNERLNTSLHALYGRRGVTDWHVGGSFGYGSDRERYVYPERKMEAAWLFGELSGQAIVRLGQKIVLTEDISGSYREHLRSALMMPFAAMEDSFVRLENDTYAYRRSNYAGIRARFRADCRIGSGRYAVFVELAGGSVFASAGGHQADLNMAAGVTF